jgi:cellulose synthase/poly-beta-1,6-N-acetylglucosamine synthase-like glycosyltransferase
MFALADIWIALEVVALAPVILLSAEIILAVTRRVDTSPSSPSPVRRGGVAVLIPAHNEASIIGETLAAIRPQLVDGDRLIVVADNCSDDTAAAARREGAETLSRTDNVQRGKGFALDFGVRYLSANPPATVIIIDADCQPAPWCIDRLAVACEDSGRPVQARYLMHARKLASPRMRIAEFAWLVKNRIRPMGLRRLGAPTHLTGSGMAFPWALIRDAPIASGHIAEDLKLGVDLACAGSSAIYCDAASIDSEFPLTARDSTTQRTRWEHGHLHIILTEAPRMLWTALRKLDPGLFLLALDLSIPPLALLVMTISLEWLVSLGFLILTGRRIPLEIASLTLASLFSAILLAWFKFGRHVVSGGALAGAVGYALMKIPVYFKFLVARQVTWVRAKRDKE